ncbi:MAG: lysophospholipase [Gammaproteobacteria bacterium]|nr:lysophospholipase [Gammaproteobacteria bacterium]
MSDNSSVHSLQNTTGTKLALTYTPAKGQHLGPVILAHGTFSNHRSLRRLAEYLSKNGYDCWLLDFQGHGHSDPPASDPNFESMCLEDAQAALDYVRPRYPSTPVIWVGHSGGGLGILTLLCRQPETANHLKAVVTIGSQATHAAKAWKNRLIIQLSRVLTKMLRQAPGHWFKLGPEPEFGPVMAQWYHWNLNGQWLGHDGFDYVPALAHIHTPTLMLSGSGDTFIAPPEGCLHLFNSLCSKNKKYVECGLHSGFSEDYNHARLVSSRNASQEIWPIVSHWLSEQ